MRKLLIAVLFGSLCLAATAQKKEIGNTKTAQHVPIPGTKVSVVPPVGFISSKSITGFEWSEKGGSILLIDLPGPFSEVTKGLTQESMAGSTMTLLKREEASIANMPALILHIEQRIAENDYAKVVFVFGTEANTIFINYTCLKTHASELMPSFLQSVETIVFEADKVVDENDALDFTVNIGGTKLFPEKSMIGTMLFSFDPSEAANPNKAILLFAKTPTLPDTDDLKSYTIETFNKRRTTRDYTIDIIVEVQVDSMLAYEIFANKKATGSTLYSLVVYSTQSFYTAIGLSPTGRKEELEQYQKVANSFKLKK